MLTPEQIKQAREKYGITPASTKNRATELQRAWATPDISTNQFEKTKEEQDDRGFWEKARDFTTGVIGGGKLAEGAGMAWASGEVNSELAKEQDETFVMQQKLIEMIRKNKAEGKDTSKLEKALAQSQGLTTFLQDAQKDFEEALPTNKEVAGSALRLAGTAAGGAIGKAGASATGLKTATGVGSGFIKGAGAGAIAGAAEGAIHGAGMGLEENKDVKGVLTSSAIGAGMGGVTGGVLGGAFGAVSGGLRGSRIARDNFAKELVMPKETPKTRAEAIYKGKFTDPKFLEKATIEASKRDELMADSIKDVVSNKASLGENVSAIRYKIDQTDTAARDYITKNKVPFNANQLKSVLETGKGDMDLIFASDSTAEKTYDAVSDAFMKQVGKKDTLGLFEARQSFDQIPAIKKLLNTAGLGENARKEIVLTVRHAANEYIASLLPQGSVYKTAMQNQTYMLEALGNIAEKNANIIGKNQLQILTQKYPLLKWLVGGVGAGIAGAASVGVGGAIIGSTD